VKKSAVKKSAGGFWRRIFTLHQSELDGRSDSLNESIPLEAVLPLSIKAGEPGIKLSKEK